LNAVFPFTTAAAVKSRPDKKSYFFPTTDLDMLYISKNSEEEKSAEKTVETDCIEQQPFSVWRHFADNTALQLSK